VEQKGTGGHTGATVDTPIADTESFSDAFEHGIDDKGRLVVPVGFRAAFAAGGLMRRWQGPCLALWTPDEFRNIDQQLRGRRRENLGNPHARRALYGGAHKFVPDRQGRVFVPEKLRAAVGIETAVVVVGVGDHVELWQPDKWEEIYADGDESLEAELQTELGY
jgi:MraZ protein